MEIDILKTNKKETTMKANWYVNRKLSVNDRIVLAALVRVNRALTKTDVMRVVSYLAPPYDENRGAWVAASRSLNRLETLGYISMHRVRNRWHISATARGREAYRAGRYVA
jgi:hypothetical protein